MTKIHMWHSCNSCNAKPIVGVRYECQNCVAGPERDLCGECYQQFLQGSLEHSVTTNVSGEPPKFQCREGRDSNEFADWLKIPIKNTLAPLIRDKFVIRPEFCVGYNSFFGSYGFIVKTEIGAVMLTALHVMDELIKTNNIDATLSNKSYTGKEIPSLIDKVNMYDVSQERWMFHELGVCEAMLTLPEARLGAEEPNSALDISGFKVNNDHLFNPSSLASTTPSIGDTVWVGIKTSDSPQPLKAVVVNVSQNGMVYRYQSEQTRIQYSSGLPILNNEGEVVAINVGVGHYEGFKFGHGNPVQSINKHLSSTT